MLWTLPQFHLSTPSPKSDLPSSSNLSSEPYLTLFLQTAFPSSVNNWLQASPTNGRHWWEFENLEDRKKGGGRCFFPSLYFDSCLQAIVRSILGETASNGGIPLSLPTPFNLAPAQRLWLHHHLPFTSCFCSEFLLMLMCGSPHLCFLTSSNTIVMGPHYKFLSIGLW